MQAEKEREITQRSWHRRTRTSNASTVKGKKVTSSAIAETASVTCKKAMDSGKPFVDRKQTAAITEKPSLGQSRRQMEKDGLFS